MIRRILIGLDVLLDTRLGVMSNLNKDAAAALVKNPDYWERDFDDWFKLTGGLVTNEQFREAYAMRGGINTAKTLNESFETGMAPFIYRLLAEADVNMMDGMTKHTDEVGLAINVAPYVLAPNERQELVRIMQEKYGRELNVKLVDYQLHELTVERLADEFGGMIIYEFAEWFKYHHVAIVGALMSDFNVIQPKLFDRDPSELTIEERKHDFFRFRLITQHNMDINYIDTRYFSLVNAKASPKEPEPVPDAE
ncbi:hypothetical protein D3C87_882050 [compost metagenome]